MFELLFLAALVILALAVLAGFTLKRQHDFKSQWPAISDEEFLAKCPPNTDAEIALKVRRIVSEQLGVAYEYIHPEQKFIDDLDC